MQALTDFLAQRFGDHPYWDRATGVVAQEPAR
jgi:hypothetical protein